MSDSGPDTYPSLFQRAENTLMMFLIGTVDDLVKIITHDAIEAALASNPINAEMIEDLVVKVTINLSSATYNLRGMIKKF